MLKKTQVVMLPTNEKAEGGLIQYSNKELRIVAVNSLITQSYLNAVQAKHYHLYFLSDEEIKKGDWILYNLHSNLKMNEYSNYDDKTLVVGYNSAVMPNKRYCRKIIATTDSSLSVIPKGETHTYLYPEPSQSFLEVFVREYNKGNVIKEVMVEYEEHALKEYDKPRVNPKDNTITIKRVKESWNREEVELLLHAFNNSLNLNNHLNSSTFRVNTWIEQNI